MISESEKTIGGYNYKLELVPYPNDFNVNDANTELYSKLACIQTIQTLPYINTDDGQTYYIGSSEKLFAVRIVINPKPYFQWQCSLFMDGTKIEILSSLANTDVCVFSGFPYKEKGESYYNPFQMQATKQRNNMDNNNMDFVELARLDRLGKVKVCITQIEPISVRIPSDYDNINNCNISAVPELPSNKKFYQYSGLGAKQSNSQVKGLKSSTHIYKIVKDLTTLNLHYDTLEHLELRKIVNPNNPAHKHLFPDHNDSKANNNNGLPINNGGPKVEHDNNNNSNNNENDLSQISGLSTEELELELAKRKSLEEFKRIKQEKSVAAESKKRELADVDECILIEDNSGELQEKWVKRPDQGSNKKSRTNNNDNNNNNNESIPSLEVID